MSVVSSDDILRVEDCGLALSFVFTFTRLGSVKGKVHKSVYYDGIYNARLNKGSIKNLKSKKLRYLLLMEPRYCTIQTLLLEHYQ